MEENYVKVYSSSNHLDAGIVRGMLQSHGVQVFSRGDILNTITGEISLEGGMIELFVHQNEAALAQELLAS